MIDDWLFTNWRLTGPILLKRSIVECVVSELPDALGSFRRQKRINEIAVILRGIGYFVLAFVLAAVLYKSAMQASLRRLALPPLSAVPKVGLGLGRKGKDIGGMDGWVDMEASNDDDADSRRDAGDSGGGGDSDGDQGGGDEGDGGGSKK